MTDWETCPTVERRPGKLNGAAVEQFLEWFPGVEEWKVRA